VLIAHLSDVHFMALDEVRPAHLIGKRFTGWVNLKLRRAREHDVEAARAVVRKIRELDVDHVVVTGDLTNLGLAHEFARVHELFERDLALPPEAVSVVPGNHDAYAADAVRQRRFETTFAAYMTDDLPGAGGVPDADGFPYVRLRGPVAIIGLRSGVPRAPLVAAGRIGVAQRNALRAVLAHAEVRRRTPVLLQHHPWHNPPSRSRRWLNGLRDADEERAALGSVARGLLLHGHMHRRIHRVLETASGALDAIGSASASSVRGDESRLAGFNLYELADADGDLESVRALRLDLATGAFLPTPVPRA
jgi:3',5'-cyclic AMP phosphodiesterase CpdA